MLGRGSYDRDYVDHCRSRIASDVSAYHALAKASKGPAVDAFEPRFFNDLVQVLDHLFVHRLRTKEGKDGNALNEVRVLCSSLMENGGVLVADRQIKLKPEASVLGYDEGDEIKIGREGFGRLAEAFFAEIEARYGS
jgi:hypothetical protein